MLKARARLAAEIVRRTLLVGLSLFLLETLATAALVLGGLAGSQLTWTTWSWSLVTAITIALAAAAVPATIRLCFEAGSRHQVLFNLAVFVLMLAYAIGSNPLHAATVPLVSRVLITLGGLCLVVEVLWLVRTAVAGDLVHAAVVMYFAGAFVFLSLFPLARYHLATHVDHRVALEPVGAVAGAGLAQTGLILTWMFMDRARRLGSFRRSAAVVIGLLLISYMIVVVRAVEISRTVRGSYASASDRPYRGPRDDVILLVVDTLRADRLGPYDHLSATPFINAFATMGITYLDHVAAASWTSPSVASIFTGRSPSAHGVHLVHWSRDNVEFRPDGLKMDVPTLAELLREQGYMTAFVGTSPLLAASFGFDRGFDYFANLLSPGPCTTPRLFWDRPVPKPYDAEQIVNRLIRVLDARRDRPLALVGHFLDAHSPYDPPAAYRPSTDGHGLPSDAYDGEVAYLDAQFGRLWNHLRETGRLDHTVVVFTADHGEAFALRTTQAPKTEDPPAGDEAYYTRMEHGHTMFQELLHVPFIIFGPRLAPRTEYHTTRTVDVLPTIIALLGLRMRVNVEGRDVLRPLTSDEPALSESVVFGLDKRSWREGRYKLVYRAGYPEGEQFELYDLTNDPAELEDLAARRWPLVLEMSRRMDSYLARVSSAGREHSPVSVDPETLDRLRSLGYVR
jgi:arylsulfatase